MPVTAGPVDSLAICWVSCCHHHAKNTQMQAGTMGLHATAGQHHGFDPECLVLALVLVLVRLDWPIKI